MSNDPTAPIKNSPSSQNSFPMLVVQEAQDILLPAQQWPLSGQVVSIGRSPDNAIVIQHTSVSRSHALLELREGRWWIHSLQPEHNPVYLRGVPIRQAAPLSSTDEICIGVVVFRFIEPQSVAIEETLPFPLALALRQPETAAGSERRLRASLLGIELIFRFLLAAQLGQLSVTRGPGRSVWELLPQDFKADMPLSMGTCVQLVSRLLRHIESQQHPLAFALRNLAQASGGSLLQQCGKMVSIRNNLVHRWFGEENAFEAEAQEASWALKTLVDALVPLRALAMVSWLSSDGWPVEAGCPLRWLQGPSSQFPIRFHKLPKQLYPGWCYLLGDGESLIPLFPSFAVATSTSTRRLDLFISRTLVTSQTAVQMDGLTCGQEARVPVPDEPGLHPLS